jgi:hypothetical protein
VYRIADAQVIQLIQSILKAGYVEDGVLKQSPFGTPQGGLCKAWHKPPCGQPVTGCLTIPSVSNTPAFNHFLISLRNALSAMRNPNSYVHWSSSFLIG